MKDMQDISRGAIFWFRTYSKKSIFWNPPVGTKDMNGNYLDSF